MLINTVHQIQVQARGRRTDLGQSQEQVARRAGVSRKWLSDFERGATTAVELPLVLRLLAALDLELDIEIAGRQAQVLPSPATICPRLTLTRCSAAMANRKPDLRWLTSCSY